MITIDDDENADWLHQPRMRGEWLDSRGRALLIGSRDDFVELLLSAFKGYEQLMRSVRELSRCRD